MAGQFWVAGIHPLRDWWKGAGHIDSTQMSMLVCAVYVLGAAVAFLRPAPDASYLAGKVGSRFGRQWTALLAVPLALMAGLGWFELRPGPSGIPAAPWVADMLLMGTLFAVGLMRPKPRDATREDDEEVDPVPWPDAMRTRGFVVEKIAHWPATPAGSESSPQQVLAELRSQSSRPVMLLGATGAGQLDIVARAAQSAWTSRRARTLVLVADDPEALIQALKKHTPSLPCASVSNALPEGLAEVALVVASVEALSERLLELFGGSFFAEHIGLVVWWDIHDYSGVSAANVWAISRRLDRVLGELVEGQVQALVMARDSTHGGSQTKAFAEAVLPYPLKEVKVSRLQPAQPAQDAWCLSQAQGTDERELIRAAVAASRDLGWRTWSADKPGEAFEHTSVWVGRLDGPLGVLRSETALLGNAVPAYSHVGLAKPLDPFRRYLLRRRAAGDRRLGFQRLVPATGSAAIAQRHLLSALSEKPDVRGRLLQTILYQDQVLNQALEELGRRNRLSQKQVRYIEQGQLILDYYYQSAEEVSRRPRPLDTVGSELIDVLDPAGGPVLRRIDPERRSIVFYPGRIFHHDGVRFRVVSSETHRVEVRNEERRAMTWRRRRALIDGASWTAMPRQHRLAQGRRIWIGRVKGTYYESLAGYAEVSFTDSGPGPLETVELPPQPRTKFETRALTLGFDPPSNRVKPAEEAIDGLIQALRHVIPVHIALSPDAFEVVRFQSSAGGQPFVGLAVVDLFPGGIGLDGALAESALILDLLRWCRDWLAACQCQSDRGCDNCIQSSEAQSCFIAANPMRGSCVLLLDDILGVDP